MTKLAIYLSVTDENTRPLQSQINIKILK